MSTVVASDYEHDLPVLQIVEVFQARDSDLAHKQLEQLMGGYQFFAS